MSTRVPLRRLPALVGLALTVLATLLALVGGGTVPAGGATAHRVGPVEARSQDPDQVSDAGERPERGMVEVAEASGLLDEVLVDFLEDRIEVAEVDGLTSLVIRLNSRGATVSDDRIVGLARRMVDSPVPVAVWVGPSGAQARAEAAQLVAVARPGGLAAGAKLGKAGAQMLSVEEFGPLWGDQANRLADGFVRGGEDDAEAIARLGLVDAAVLVDFVGSLEGVAVREVPASETGGEAGERELGVDVRFTSLDLGGQLAHTVASPSVAYLLFAIGLGLIVFELFTAGIGLAGVVGAVCLALGCYGLAALPVRGWAVVALVAAFAAFCVDVQTGVPRVWTAIGFALFVVGSLALFSRLSPSWITWSVAFVGVLLAFLSGMPAMVRTRFSTATIGRDWMVGEMGLALTDLDPDGTVSVRSARWPGRTNRATPLRAGDRIRVVSIEGITLEVEPETGGARDHRERRGREAAPPSEGARDS
jgi:membrane-bound serine protease (ClpP class)